MSPAEPNPVARVGSKRSWNGGIPSAGLLLHTNPTTCPAPPGRRCSLFWGHSIRELQLFISYLQAVMWSISQLHNCRINLVQTWYTQLNMFACSRVCTELHTNSDTESEWGCFRCAHGLTHGILPDLGRVTGCNVWTTSLQELPVAGASGIVKTCLAESVSVICFKCAVIVSGLSTACFPLLLLKSPLESRSVGPECKTIHVQGAGILNIQANCRVGEITWAPSVLVQLPCSPHCCWVSNTLHAPQEELSCTKAPEQAAPCNGILLGILTVAPSQTFHFWSAFEKTKHSAEVGFHVTFGICEEMSNWLKTDRTNSQRSAEENTGAFFRQNLFFGVYGVLNAAANPSGAAHLESTLNSSERMKVVWKGMVISGMGFCRFAWAKNFP